MLHPGALSQKNIKKKLFLSAWKLFDMHKKVSFHASDEEEKKHIEHFFGEEINILVAGNYPRKFKQHSLVKKNGFIKLVSVGLISPMKNHLMILEAFEHTPAIIEYHRCGPVKDMVYWQKCLDQMKQLPVNVTVKYHGEVAPGLVEEMLHKGHVFILPSKSENFGHAFYEALSAGKPVITSDNTPWQNLEEKMAGINSGLNVNEIADAIVFFAAMPQEEYDKWSEGAEQYAKNALDIDKTRKQYEQMFSGQTAIVADN